MEQKYSDQYFEVYVQFYVSRHHFKIVLHANQNNRGIHFSESSFSLLYEKDIIIFP